MAKSAKGLFFKPEKMNQVLVNNIERFIALNPEMVDAVMQEYGIGKEVPLNVKTIVDAFKIHGEAFARDLYDALLVDIDRARKASLSNYVSPNESPIDSSTEVQASSGGWDWNSFFTGLTGLAGAAPNIINAANGNTYPYGNYANMNVPGYYPPPTTSSMNILMYVGIAVAIIVVLIVVFKKA